MTTFNFTTKGETLERLSQHVKKSKILPLFRLQARAFNRDTDKVISDICNSFSHELLIIRSSTRNEDNLENSNAGHYKTILNVSKADQSKLKESIKEVIASYDSDSPDNEVLIQPMLANIRLSGVALTADLDTLAPYYIINYDESGRSDTITSGKGDNAKTFLCFKDSLLHITQPDLLKICNACKEVERITNNSNLDIEFALDKNGDFYIFQCRPIVIKNKEATSTIYLKKSIEKIYNKIEKLSSSHPNLLGDRTMFGVMPDWNPAEIIGLRPKQGALSLYKELITDNIWAYQRDNYGYRNLRSHPLLISFLGIPYIDVRVDFNSFVPKSLDEGIAKKLVSYYLNKLDSIPTLHDKVEFQIVHSCYYLNLPEKLKHLQDHGFNENEIKRIEFSLLNITNDIINPNHGLYKKDLQKIEILKEKYNEIINSDISIIEKIYWLIEDCKRFGTLPFAGVARAAFIAVQFLKSFVDLKIITNDEYNNFMRSLNTIAKKLNYALCELFKGEITKEEFLSEYGHLRPNTYDILSLRYDENFDYYFLNIKREFCESISFDFRPEQTEKIDLALIENGLNIDANGLIQFLKEAIEGREYSKFVFTKSLSEILRLIIILGKENGISKEDLAYLDIRTLIHQYAALEPNDLADILKADIRRNKEIYEYTKAIKLPALIRNPQDVHTFFVEDEEGNFITLKKVEATIIMENEFPDEKLENKIVFIKSADPGYDYLFTKRIAGLITQFGGANSHMAIRCAELGIPAVIGAGEKKFTAWSRATTLEIDCSNRQVRVIV